MFSRVLAVLLVVSCAGSSSDAKQPRTAREKQLQEARATGEIDDTGKSWSGWRYQGDRGDCFYVLGRRCYKTEDTACKAARCKSPKKCTPIGAGPATIRCE